MIETHCHAIGAGLDALDAPYVELRSIADVQAWIRTRAAELPRGRWIRVPRTDIMRLDEMRFPTVAELDEASASHPVILTSVRKDVLNTAAWRAIGVVDKDDSVDGATIVRDAAGAPWMLSGGNALLRALTPRREYSSL